MSEKLEVKAAHVNPAGYEGKTIVDKIYFPKTERHAILLEDGTIGVEDRSVLYYEESWFKERWPKSKSIPMMFDRAHDYWSNHIKNPESIQAIGRRPRIEQSEIEQLKSRIAELELLCELQEKTAASWKELYELKK